MPKPYVASLAEHPAKATSAVTVVEVRLTHLIGADAAQAALRNQHLVPLLNGNSEALAQFLNPASTAHSNRTGRSPRSVVHHEDDWAAGLANGATGLAVYEREHMSLRVFGHE